MQKRNLLLTLVFAMLVGVFGAGTVMAQEVLTPEEIEDGIRRFALFRDDEVEFNRVVLIQPCQAYFGATRNKPIDGLVIAPGQEFQIDRMRVRREFADDDVRAVVTAVEPLWVRVKTNRKQTGARPYWLNVRDCGFVKDVRAQ